MMPVCEDDRPEGIAVELNEIGRRCGELPVVSELSEDEILGYDDMGIPTR